MIKQFPQTIYVKRELSDPDDTESEYFVLSETLEALLEGTEENGEPVGVYELKSAKRVTIKKSLDEE